MLGAVARGYWRVLGQTVVYLYWRRLLFGPRGGYDRHRLYDVYASMAVGQLLRGHRIVAQYSHTSGFIPYRKIISLIMVLGFVPPKYGEALEGTDNLSLINMGAWNPFSGVLAIAACLNLVLCVSVLRYNKLYVAPQAQS